MGWWEEKTGRQKLLLGDEPMDLLMQALEDFTHCYEEEVGRKPTLAEFHHCLERIVRGCARDRLAGLEQLEIAALSIKTKKAPKRIPYKVGDYFAIPLEDGRFFYGRILHDAGLAELIEVYKLNTQTQLTFEQLLARKPEVAFYKHVCVGFAFNKAKWRVIGHERIPKDFQYPCFYLAQGLQISRGDKRRPCSLEESARLEPKMVFVPDQIEQRLAVGLFDNWPEIAEARQRDFAMSRRYLEERRQREANVKSRSRGVKSKRVKKPRR